MPDIKLKFILSGTDTNRHSGATLEFVIDDSKNATELKVLIRSQWPEAFADVHIERKKLSIVHCGQMLDEAKTLKECGLVQTDPPTTLHLMLQPLIVEAASAPAPAKQEQPDKGCCCQIQ
jgi:hypothetical protein